MTLLSDYRFLKEDLSDHGDIIEYIHGLTKMSKV
jgi:hypothetical protein